MSIEREKGESKDKPLELGFGQALNAGNLRLVNKDGSFNIERKGRPITTAYQTLVEMSWGRFLLLVLSLYVVINACFALLLVASGVENIGIQNVQGIEAFFMAFFFSVQTYTTVGYGVLSPTGITTNLIASLIALSGLLSVAMATGLVFARFSKPKAQITFSKHALIAPYKDGWSFQFRIANLRNNSIINVHATLVMSWLEKVGDNKIRHFARLPLELDHISLFP